MSVRHCRRLRRAHLAQLIGHVLKKPCSSRGMCNDQCSFARSQLSKEGPLCCVSGYDWKYCMLPGMYSAHCCELLTKRK